MKNINAIMISAIAILGASSASAQTETRAAPAAATEAPSATPSPEAQGQTQVRITPQDIDNFAKAVIEVNKIQADTSLDKTQKQTAMTAAVQKSDLDAFKFNTMVQASKTNAELKQRVQLAIAQQQKQ